MKEFDLLEIDKGSDFVKELGTIANELVEFLKGGGNNNTMTDMLMKGKFEHSQSDFRENAENVIEKLQKLHQTALDNPLVAQVQSNGVTEEHKEVEKEDPYALIMGGGDY